MGQRIKVKDAASVQKVMDDIESLKHEKKNTVADKKHLGLAETVVF